VPIAILLAAIVGFYGGHAPVRCAADLNPAFAGAYTGSEILLQPDLCDSLERLAEGQVDTDTAFAALAFTHEAMHASGKPDALNETLTECRAIHYVPLTGLLFGLDREDDWRLLQLAEGWHEWDRAASPVYRTAPCSTFNLPRLLLLSRIWPL
jgi:hypothetical protein